MATPPLRAILVGCGSIAGAWLPDLRAHSDVELVALVDLDPAAARRCAEKYDLGNVALETDLAAALARHTPVDVVFDLTIPAAHQAVTTTALHHGCHVLGEKPLAETMPQARAAVAAAAQAGRLYVVMQNRRYTAGGRRLRAFIESGVLGRVTTACCDFFLGLHFSGFRAEMDHVLLLDMSIHHFDLARFLLAGISARAVTCHEWNPPGASCRHGGAASAAFEMADDITFLYRGSWLAQGLATSWQGAWRIVGEHGSVAWDGENGFQAQLVEGGARSARTVRDIEVPLTDCKAQSHGHGSVIAAFLAAVRQGTIPETVCTDNIHSLAMVLGAVASAGSRARVEIPA